MLRRSPLPATGLQGVRPATPSDDLGHDDEPARETGRPRSAPRSRRALRGGVALCALALALVAPAAARAVTITEIMFNPRAADEAAAGGANLEWIEIYNEEATVVDLSGYWFSQGIGFVFPPDTWLDGRSYLVVCGDEAAVRAHYEIDNTIGDFIGRLDNDGETIALNIYGGGPEVKVTFSDRNQWPQAADGTGHSLSLLDPYLDPDENDSWTWSREVGGTPGAENFPEAPIDETVLIADDAVWRFRRNTSEYPPSWNQPGYDDSSWEEGAVGIGYGDDDDRTELTDMEDNYSSIAARKTFTLSAEDIAFYDSIVLRIRYDDGFIGFLNGVEFARSRMGSPGEPVSFQDRASSHESVDFEDFFIEPSLLVDGVNTFAFAAHNATIGSSDFSFWPYLVGRRQRDSARPVPVVINECLPRTAGEGWVELHNTSATPVDLSGFHLSDDPGSLTRHTFPAGTILGAHDFLVATESQTGLTLRGEIVKVYLSRPGGSGVVAAEHFDSPLAADPPLDGTSEARIPDGNGRFAVSTTPTPGAPNLAPLVEDVVIHEILYHPPDGTHDGLAFIELYNRGGAPVDLSGCRFSRGVDYAFLDGTTIAPGAFLVIAEDPARLEAAHGISGTLGPWDGNLSNSGELVRLVDPFGNTMDEVRYADGGRWSKWADGGGSSLELIDPDQDNSVASSWEASDESSKSVWEEVELVIDNYRQQSESELQIRMLAAGECLVDAIELTRGATSYAANGGFESSTSGWIIEGNHIQSHRTTEDAFEGNACLKIIATGDGDLRANRIERETSPSMISGDYVLRAALRWLRGGNLIYFSGYRQPAEFQFTHWMTIPQNLGTPGAPNSVGVANMGPAISEVLHSPAVPEPSQSVQVTARVSDSDAVAAVAVVYETSGGATDSVDMFDDGLHGDGEADDGLWGGTIPGQGSNTKVKFWIEAEDALGAVRSFPRQAPARWLVYEHSTPLTANSFTFRVVHDPDTWSELNTRRLHSNELLDATFVFNEKHVYYNVGTRYRGSPWQRPGNPKMYRVSFNKDDRYRRRRALNLSRYGNQQNERVAFYSVWRNSTSVATAPMSRGSWGRVRSTGGTFTMEAVEPINSDYLGLWFPDDSDGILMKITGKQTFDDNGNHQGGLIQWASYANRGSSDAGYRWNFNIRTRELEDDFGPLKQLVQTMNSSSSVIDSQLESIMDVEQFLRVYAARCAHDDWDTIAIGNGQNAYVYYASNEGRWKLLPWDLDHSWGNANARIYPDADGAMARVLQRPQYRRKYQGILNEMLNGRGGNPGHWTVGEIVTKFADRNSTVVGPDGVGGSGGIRNFINARTGGLRNQIPAQTEFQITSNGGNDFTADEPTAEIAGRGWVDVDTILVNGEPAVLEWSSTTAWRLEVELLAGTNPFSLIAVDVEGNVVGADSIDIQSTVGWNPPTITSIEPAAAMPGEMVTIRGTEFHEGIVVTFGSTLAPTVEFDEDADPATLRAEVPLLRDGPVLVHVTNVDNRPSEDVEFTVLPLPPVFIRGDVNLDRSVDVSDAVRIARYLFAGATATCLDAGDVDDDEVLTITDAIALLGYLYQDAAPPATPFPEVGQDSSGGGALSCERGLDLFAD